MEEEGLAWRGHVITAPLNISWVGSLVLRASMFRMSPSHDWQVDSGSQIRTWPGLWFFFMWNSPWASPQCGSYVPRASVLKERGRSEGHVWPSLSGQTKVKELSFNHVRLFAIPWTVAARLLCPGNSPDKNTGVGCHSLLQGIFPTQESNLSLLHCRQILYHLSYCYTWAEVI